MRYSIVIPTYNRKKTLQMTLDSTIVQTILPSEYEIIVVDDGSIDGTRSVVEEFIEKHPARAIRYFWQENGGPAKARNFGIKESRGEIIFFTDDDCVVPENWMETLLDGFCRYPNAGGVGGWYKPGNKKLGRLYFQRYIDLIFFEYYRFQPDEAEIQTNVFSASPAGNTANMVYRKKIFDQCGMFDENLTFAGLVDWEFKARVQFAGLQLVYLPSLVSHYKKMTLKHFVKLCFDRGRGWHYVSMKYRNFSGQGFLNLKLFDIIIKIISCIINRPKFFPARIIEQAIFLTSKYYMVFSKVQPTRYSMANTDNEWSITRLSKNDGILRITRSNRFKKLTKDESNIFYPPDLNIKFDGDKLYSIIIPTYNRAIFLARALSGLAKQSIGSDKYEIIIIDDGSTDATTDIVERFKLDHPTLIVRYFFQKNSGPAKARNRGIREANGDIIFFTDDDALVPENWMETFLSALQKYPEAVGVGGWMVPPEGEMQKSIVSRHIYANIYFSESPNGYRARFCETLSNNPFMCFGIFAFNTANLCYKRGVLEESGGFREDFYWPGSEDNDLAFRIALSGHSLLYIPFHVIHSKDMSLVDFAKLHFRRGANGYLLRKLNYQIMDKLSPGLVERFGSFSKYLHLIMRWKLLAIIELVSVNLGVSYMKSKIGPLGLIEKDTPQN